MLQQLKQKKVDFRVNQSDEAGFREFNSETNDFV